MKHTDFFEIIRKIKEQETNELFKAVELHKGKYEWSIDKKQGYPLITINSDITRDAKVTGVYIKGEALKIKGIDEENGELLSFSPSDVIAGYISYIIDFIPEINGVSDVSAPSDMSSKIHNHRKNGLEEIRELLRGNGPLKNIEEDGEWTAFFIDNDGNGDSSLYSVIELEKNEKISVMLENGLWLCEEDLTTDHVEDILTIIEEEHGRKK